MSEKATIMKKMLERIKHLSSELNKLRNEYDYLLERLANASPVWRNEEFSYDGEYCGIFECVRVAEWTVDKPYPLIVEYHDKDGDYHVIYNVDPDKLERVKSE